MKHVYVYVSPIVPVLHDNGINKCCFLFIMFVGAGTHLSIFLAVMKVGSNTTGLYSSFWRLTEMLIVVLWCSK